MTQNLLPNVHGARKLLLFSKPKTQLKFCFIKYFLHGFNVYAQVYCVNQGKIML